MRTITKLAIVIVSIIAILCLSPFFLGRFAESKLQELVTNLNSSQEVVEVTITQYDRGWFRSEVTVQEASLAAFVNLTPREHKITILHGPIIFHANKLRVALAEMIPQNRTTEAEEYMRLTFNGDFRMNMRMSKQQWAAEGISTSFDNIEVVLGANPQFDDLTLGVTVHQFASQNAEQKMNAGVEALQVAANGTLQKDNHWIWQFSVDITNANVDSQQMPEIGDFSLHFNQLRFDDLSYNTAFSNNFMEIFAQSAEITEKQYQDLQALMQKVMTQLITPSSKVVIDNVTFKSAMAEFSLDASVAFPNLPKAHDYFDVTWFQQGSFNFSLPLLQLSQQGSSLSVKELNMASKTSQHGAAKGQFTIKEFTVEESGDDGNISLQDLSLDFTSSASQDDASWQMVAKIANGCFLKSCIKDFSADLQASGLSVAAMRDIINNTTGSIDVNNTRQAMQVLAQYGKLIKNTSLVNLSFKAQSDTGTFDIQASVDWKNLPKKAGMLGVLAYANYSLSGSLPTEWVNTMAGGDENEDNFIQELMNNKMLIEDGDHYRLQIKS